MRRDRISLPLTKLPTGRYAVQVVVIGAGTQQAAFGRAYLAVQREPAALVPGSSPSNPPSSAPAGESDPSAPKPPGN